MIAGNEYRPGDVLIHLSLVAFLFAAFSVFSYHIGLNSAEKANLIAQGFAEKQVGVRDEAAPAYFGLQPVLLNQNMNDKAITANINYSDRGE